MALSSESWTVILKIEIQNSNEYYLDCNVPDTILDTQIYDSHWVIWVRFQSKLSFTNEETKMETDYVNYLRSDLSGGAEHSCITDIRFNSCISQLKHFEWHQVDNRLSTIKLNLVSNQELWFPAHTSSLSLDISIRVIVEHDLTS